MLSVKLAKNIGFCSGVRRAVNIVEETLIQSNGKVYSLGPVIHNPEVIKQLKEKNLCIVNSLDNLEDSSTLILPSHGSPRNILNAAKKKKLSFKDQQELIKLPDMIDELEAKQAALTQQISSSAFYKKDPLAIAKTLDELKVIEAKLEQVYARWNELEAMTEESPG